MTEDSKFDEQRYDRQLRVLSREAMVKITQTEVLIIGLTGVGVELAKNVILAGVKRVVLHDNEPTTYKDLSSQFYLSESDIGKPRAASCLDQLADLNYYVLVSVHTGELDAEFLSKFHVVALFNQPQELQLRVNDITHPQGKGFISVESLGVFGNVFTDFGDNFVVHDTNGEPPASHLVSSITSDGVVTVSDESRLKFEDNDAVTFKEVVGLDALNHSKEGFDIKILGPYTFSIGDVSKYGQYKIDGYATQLKKPKTLNFKSLRESLKDPEFVISDYAKFDHPPQLHVGFQALHAFRAKHSSLPAPHNDEQASEVLATAKEIANGKATIDDKLIKQLAYGAQGDISPMAAILGAIGAQEVLKFASGKFHPVFQWCYIDAIEALPEGELSPAEFQPIGSRYDGNIITIGRTLNEKLQTLSYFLVGAGAIGCEMLKTWAMMGVACGGGKIHVTDMDTIEKSNLSRQFLFRPTDIDKLKSQTAAISVAKMNPNINITSYSLRVGQDTENVFNEEFYKCLFGVCNALDNIEARTYMDTQCIFHKKPLLESGTLGTKGNTQVVVPHLTESYSSSFDPPETSYPICTLKHFPSLIEHTLQWARDLFEGLYKNSADNVNSYFSNPSFLEGLTKQNSGTRLEILTTIHDCISNKPLNFAQCIIWARLQFEELYANSILQLLYSFPKDMLTTTGTPFWSGHRRIPVPLKFNPEDPLHLDFITAAANLKAENYGLKGERDPKFFSTTLAQLDIVVPEFSPKKTTIQVNENEAQSSSLVFSYVCTHFRMQSTDDESVCDRITAGLPASSSNAVKMNPINFEKDDDTNFHMDFITAASNLRATNYNIVLADKLKSKGIAGKIIPAMVTTTALVTGLVCIELLKLAQNKKLEQYKNGYANLALPLFAFSEPRAPIKTVSPGWTFTLWDRFEIQGDMLLGEFLEYFEREHQLEINMISADVFMLYSCTMSQDKKAERLAMKVSDLFTSISKKPLPALKKYLVLELTADHIPTGKDAEVPYVKYNLPL